MLKMSAFDEELYQLELVDNLTKHGIDAEDVKKLQDAGIYTCSCLMTHWEKELTAITGFSKTKAEKIYVAAEKKILMTPVTTSLCPGT
nr:PREDICTED: meiotic recombination protein DMC1 homolog [Daucus carota subsp. sativus]